MRAPLIALRYRAAAAYLLAFPWYPGALPAKLGKRSSLPGMHRTASGKSAGTAALQPTECRPIQNALIVKILFIKAVKTGGRVLGTGTQTEAARIHSKPSTKRVTQKQCVLPVGIVRAAAEDRGKPNVRTALAVTADRANARPYRRAR